jgi:hypothetical protein
MQGLQVSAKEFKFKAPDVHYHQQYLPDDGSWKPTVQTSDAHYRKNIRSILQSVKEKGQTEGGGAAQAAAAAAGSNPFAALPSSVLSTMESAKQLLQSAAKNPPRLGAGGRHSARSGLSASSNEFAVAGDSHARGGAAGGMLARWLAWADINQLSAIGLISVRSGKAIQLYSYRCTPTDVLIQDVLIQDVLIQMCTHTHSDPPSLLP